MGSQMHTMRTRMLAGGLLIAAAAIALTGCANPIDQLVQAGTEQVIERVAEESTGGQVDINTGSGASLPDGWPDIPTPDGDILMSAAANEGMTATFQTSQSEADRVVADLRAAGYTEEANMETEDIRIVSFVNDEWRVGLTISPDSADPDLITVMYVVAPAMG